MAHTKAQGSSSNGRDSHGIVTFEWAYRGKKQISVYPKETETKKAAAPKAKKAPAKAKKTETK